MIFNSRVNLQYTYRMKQYRIECELGNYHEGIPIYYCESIEDVSVIQFEDDSVMVLINKHYEENSKEEALLKIWHNLLQIFFGNHKSNYVKDICCAYWFGFTKLINIIEESTNISEEEKKSRINKLEKVMSNSNDIIIPNKEDIIKNIKFITTVI